MSTYNHYNPNDLKFILDVTQLNSYSDSLKFISTRLAMTHDLAVHSSTLGEIRGFIETLKNSAIELNHEKERRLTEGYVCLREDGTEIDIWSRPGQ